MDSIILASSSPRRKELLETMQIQFKVIPANCDESVPAEIRAMDAPLHIAEKKAKAIIRQLNSDEPANFVLPSHAAITDAFSAASASNSLRRFHNFSIVREV